MPDHRSDSHFQFLGEQVGNPDNARLFLTFGKDLSCLAALWCVSVPPIPDHFRTRPQSKRSAPYALFRARQKAWPSPPLDFFITDIDAYAQWMEFRRFGGRLIAWVSSRRLVAHVHAPGLAALGVRLRALPERSGRSILRSTLMTKPPIWGGHLKVITDWKQDTFAKNIWDCVNPTGLSGGKPNRGLP